MSSTPSAFILTSSPFLLSQVTLASFVPNIGQPHQDAKRPYEILDSDYSVQADAVFAGQLETNSKTFFDVLATKFASFSVAHENSNTLRILAESGKIYSLNNPDDLFQSIVFGSETGPEMQRWLEHCRLRRLAPRFVTAYRTFVDASVSSEKQTSTGVSGSAMAPVSSALGDPMGAADIEIRAGRHSDTGVKISVSTPGERIYAICYRRIKVKEIWGTSVAPSLDYTNKWKPFASLSRGDSEDTYLQAWLSKEGDRDAEERYEAKCADGETAVFGVISGLGSDSEYESDSE